MFLVGIYAPPVDSGVAERRTLRQNIDILLRMKPATSLVLLLGDFNSEMGNNMDHNIEGREVMGRFSQTRVNEPGQEWRRWFLRHHLRDTATRYFARHGDTWTHPRFGSHHELDHIVIQRQDLWCLQHARALREGPSVRDPWTPYTDHNPLEVKLRIGKFWVPPQSRQQQVRRPDLSKLKGAGEVPEHLRRIWTQKVEEKLDQLEPLDHDSDLTQAWNQICNICREVAIEVCGVVHMSRGAPWLRSRGPEIQQLDHTILLAKQRDQQARQQDNLEEREYARRALQQARKEKTQRLQQWEVAWLTEKAEEANRALSTPNVTDMFKIVKTLCQEVGGKPRDGSAQMAAGPEVSEAWKHHFATIQQGAGNIADSVWQDIEPREEAPDIGQTPTWEEYLRVIRDMHTGKASGEDTFVAKYLKMAGHKLLSRIFTIVQQCWRTASEVLDQEQAHEWPASWSTGIIIPLWKRKGDRHNKHTWRGITLLSVGSKIVARISALRLGRWTNVWLNPLQFGFRAGSGVDDIQQISRRLLEETSQSNHAATYLFRFYDLEKVYPKVVRHGLWDLLRREGCPHTMVNIC